MSAARVVAGIVAQLQERFEVGVPGFEIHTRRALALAALIDRRHGGVQRLQPRYDAVRQPVGGANQRAFRPHAVPGHADAAGELRQQGDVLVFVVYPFQRIGRGVEQEAAGELFVQSTGVEQRRRARQVVERGEQPVQFDCLVRRAAQGHGDAHPKIGRRFEDVAFGRMFEQIAVVQSAQSEILEAPGALHVDGIIEFSGMRLDELQHPFVDQADIEAGPNGLGKGMNTQALDFLVDERREQSCGKLRIRRLVGHEGRGRPDRQFIQFARGGSIVEAGNGLQRHSHGIHIRDSVAAARDGPHDLVDVDWFMRARALLDAHGDTRRVRRSQHEFGLARVEERRAAGCR